MPTIVAERTETKAPPTIAGKPNFVIIARFSGTNTPILPNKIPM